MLQFPFIFSSFTPSVIYFTRWKSCSSDIYLFSLKFPCFPKFLSSLSLLQRFLFCSTLRTCISFTFLCFHRLFPRTIFHSHFFSLHLFFSISRGVEVMHFISHFLSFPDISFPFTLTHFPSFFHSCSARPQQQQHENHQQQEQQHFPTSLLFNLRSNLLHIHKTQLISRLFFAPPS